MKIKRILKNKELKNTFYYIFSSFFGAFLPLISVPIFTNYLSVEQFGTYALIQVYSIFLVGVCNFGLTTAYEREFFEYDSKIQKSTLFFSVTTFVFVLLILAGTITFILKSNISNFFFEKIDYENLILLSFMATAFNNLKLYFLIYFKNIKNAKLYALYNIFEITFTYISSIVFLIFLDMGISALIVGQLLSNFIVLLLLLFFYLKDNKFLLNKSFLIPALKISFPLTPKIFFGIIGSQFDKYMLGMLNSVGGVGIYNVGHKLANVSFILMTAIQQVYAPNVYNKMFKLSKIDAGKSIGKYLMPYMYLSVLFCLLVCLFSEEIIIMMTPVEYHGAIKITIILSLLYSTMFFGKQPQLIYSKKTWLSSMLLLLSIALNILINIPFIYKWGALGAAYATLLGGLISNSIAYFLYQKYFFIHWEFKKTILIYISLYLFIFISLILFDLEYSYLIRLFLKVLFLSAFILIGYSFKLFLNIKDYTVKFR